MDTVQSGFSRFKLIYGREGRACDYSRISLGGGFMTPDLSEKQAINRIAGNLGPYINPSGLYSIWNCALGLST